MNAARFEANGYLLTAFTRVPLDRFRQEMANLKSQGFSPYDPGVRRDVARRLKIPTGLLVHDSGRQFYRVTVQVEPGSRLILQPGAVMLTLDTSEGPRTVRDSGCLLEDPDQPSGLASVHSSTIELERDPGSKPGVWRLLVSTRLKGKITALDVDPVRVRMDRPPMTNAALGEAGRM